MKSIPQYHFHKTKYGEELLIDVVSLDNIRKYIERDSMIKAECNFAAPSRYTAAKHHNEIIRMKKLTKK